MAKFRKKPVVIEAEQFFREPVEAWPVGVEGVWCRHPFGSGECNELEPHVHTLEGPLRVSDGDWIVTGVQGERYPVKPDIFAATYEAVEDVSV